jgi:hypothetical protein
VRFWRSSFVSEPPQQVAPVYPDRVTLPGGLRRRQEAAVDPVSNRPLGYVELRGGIANPAEIGCGLRHSFHLRGPRRELLRWAERQSCASQTPAQAVLSGL